MCGGRGEKKGVRTRGKERYGEVMERGRTQQRKEAKSMSLPLANRYEGLKVEAVEAVVARCCQVLPAAYLTGLCRSKTGTVGQLGLPLEGSNSEYLPRWQF